MHQSDIIEIIYTVSYILRTIVVVAVMTQMLLLLKPMVSEEQEKGFEKLANAQSIRYLS